MDANPGRNDNDSMPPLYEINNRLVSPLPCYATGAFGGAAEAAPLYEFTTDPAESVGLQIVELNAFNTTYEILPNQNNTLFDCDWTGGTVGVNMPAANTVPLGFTVIFRVKAEAPTGSGPGEFFGQLPRTLFTP